jgi:hypothetical protein
VEFLRGWALDFAIEYMTRGRSAARAMCTAVDDQRLNAGGWDARDAIQLLTDVVDEAPGAVLDQEHERKYFAECAQAFVRESDPKSIVIECSRILGKKKALRDRPSIEIQGGSESERWFFRGRSGGDGRDFGLVDVDGAEREVRCQLSGIRCQVGGELGGALLAASR